MSFPRILQHETHRQRALAHIRSNEPVDGSVFCIPCRQSLHLIAMDASEHEDGHSGEEDEGNDWYYNNCNQGGHAIGGKPIICKERETSVLN